MTWHVSPEEWLLDFTSVPRGRVRAGESLDAIDDRLRSMLTPLPGPMVLPSITGRRPAAPPRPEREPSRPVPEIRPAASSGPRDSAAPAEPAPARSVLDVELVPLTTPTDDEPPPPKPAAAPPAAADAMVIPSLTRHNFDIDDDDEAEALDRISPERSSPQMGIPDDDADDLMSAMAAGSQILEPTPPPAEDEPEDELDPDAVEFAENSGLITMPVMPSDEPEDDAPATPVAAEALVEKPVEKTPPPAEKAPPPPPAEKAAPPPPPAAEKAPPPPPPVDKSPDKPAPPPPPVDKASPAKTTIPPPPGKAPPPVTKPPPPASPVAAPPAAAAAAASGRKRGWFDEAFGDHYASIQPIDSDQSAELDAVFIRKSAELGAGQTVLDVACGDGRHCFALANLGLMVTGLDCSLSQLVRASQRNEATEAGVTLLHGDMRALPRDRTYDVVTCLGSSIGYFDGDEQNRQVLQEMIEVLRPGGKLVLQVFNRDYMVAVMPCRSWWQGRGCLVLDVADMNYFTNRIRIHRTVVFEDGRQFEHHMYFRAYSLHELGKILTGHGMRVLEVSGSRETRGRFYGATSPEIWLVAQRREDS